MKQDTHLRSLHKRLARLRRRRARFRWATAASAVAISVLWALAGVFFLDWSFQRNIDLKQRLLLEGVAAACVAWAIARFARPWLGKRENELDMALLVEKQAGIDTDLVAALQFETDEAPRWGSAQLEAAVIDQAAVEERHVNVMAAVPRQPLARRLKVLLATAAAWAIVSVFLPQYVSVFFQRLAFQSAHYPSQTQVVNIAINGKPVDLSTIAERAVHVPFAHAVAFEVTVAGSQPLSGRVEISNRSGGPSSNVTLAPIPSESSDPTPARYRGEHARLIESARCQVYLGDAWTDPISLSVTPLPAVEIETEVVLPDYARRSGEAPAKLPRGMREFSVLAGSEVKFILDSDRPIQAAEVTIAGKAFAMQRENSSEREDDTSAPKPESWRLPTAGTPLASVAKELAYSIQVHDAEGQTLERPLEGTISIEPDMPPSIIARTKSTVVLPTGSPSIHYEAADDHALRCIWLTWEATPGNPDGRTADYSDKASPAGQASGDAPGEKREGRIEICSFTPDTSPRSREADFSMQLKSLPLKRGDTLKVTLHASDFRGPAEPAVADADPPLVFQVTDLRGFEASMYEADLKSAGALEDIRKKHTGVGDSQ